MNKIIFFLLLLFICLSSMLFGTLILQADDGTSQNFTMQNRYALLAGSVLVQSEMTGDRTIADAIFKIDAMTGEVWILQLKIDSPQRPRIVAADFVPTATLSSD
ncbi:MAG: hypothetical protein IJW31_00675 [Lentisphaeria bacterium]|nr:hypothetical protein [Lentisphaeria bacterium]